MTSTVRDSFVARFGEDDALRIEEAAEGHLAETSIHADDDRGGDPFQYLFLAAIGSECVSRFREHHGIKASEEDMREWALAEGRLGSATCDVPDYLALIGGAYDGWVADGENA